MQLKRLKGEATELEGRTVRMLFSYDTLVAVHVFGLNGWRYYVTSKHWSSTTSRHISSWLSGAGHYKVSQEQLEQMVKLESQVNFSFSVPAEYERLQGKGWSATESEG